MKRGVNNEGATTPRKTGKDARFRKFPRSLHLRVFAPSLFDPPFPRLGRIDKSLTTSAQRRPKLSATLNAMKTWILLWSLLFTALGATAADPLTEALQRGLLAEEAQKDLTAAASAYREAIELGDRQRTMVATALFRLAEAERALGRTNEALTWYRRLMREYPEATNLTALAERRLLNSNSTDNELFARLRTDLTEKREILRAFQEERQRYLALTNDAFALALALKAFHSTLGLEKLIGRIQEVEVELEALKLRKDSNDPERRRIEATVAELRVLAAAENAAILRRLAAREVEHAKAIGTQEEVLARFASKGEFPSPVNSPPAGPEKL
ncbi:MAG: hypothetical protein J0L84_10865, partial [Verrucomicrobia bacterium]|nr:hypothetical protein [Verrucomicrobiota bacterium]